MKNKLNWSPLDNTARVYPALTNKRTSRVFRLFCQLKDPVNPAALQKAVDQSVVLFPNFTETIRHGLFWYYREESNLRPQVHREDQPPCQNLYNAHTRSLLIDISYYGTRINLEVFHGLADGAGALIFLRAVLLFYFRELHPELYPEEEPEVLPAGTAREWAEDAFAGNVTASKSLLKNQSIWKNRFNRVYQLPGQSTLDRRQLITEGLVSAQRIRQAAKKYNTTVTAYLTSVLFMSIYDTMHPLDRKKPVCVVLPVNLRKYFPTNTLRNFFILIEVKCTFDQLTANFEKVTAEVTKIFQRELNQEKLQEHMAEQVKISKSPGVRFVPLPIKTPVIILSNQLVERQHTMVLSNMGQIVMPEESASYIQRFGGYLASPSRQIVLCTYGDQMNICFASGLRNRDVERAFFRRLAMCDPDIIVTTNYGEEIWK